MPNHTVVTTRQKSALGQPKAHSKFERACKTCGASFLGLAPGKTGECGVWIAEWVWCCSTECADKSETPCKHCGHSISHHDTWGCVDCECGLPYGSST